MSFWLKTFFVVIMIIGVGAVVFYYNYLVPIKGMAPTGQYNTGRTSFDVEYASKTSGNTRKLNIIAWYPTRDEQGELALYQSLKLGKAVAKIYNMPEVSVSEEVSYSFIDAKVAMDQSHYPVIIFNHGSGSFQSQNNVQMENLASHGYIILSIGHPGGTILIEYADGSHLKYDPDHPSFKEIAKAKDNMAQIYQDIAEAYRGIELTGSFEQYWQSREKVATGKFFSAMQPVLAQWFEDSEHIVNTIANGDGGKLSDKIGSYFDKNKIGALGHSLGGMTSSLMALNNNNIKTAFNLDGPPFYSLSLDGLTFDKPNCYTMSDIVIKDKATLDQRYVNLPILEKSTAFGCNVVFKQSDHMSFTDLNYVGLVKLFGILGNADQEKLGAELNHLIVWFFDKTLKGKPGGYVPIHQEMVEYKAINE